MIVLSPPRNARAAMVGATVLLLAFLQSCSPSYTYKEKAMPESVKLSERLQSQFVKTKLVCFGRYALAVPIDAKLIWGSASFPSRIDTIKGGKTALERRVALDMAKIKTENDAAEIFYNGEGPVENSWQIRYYQSEYMKSVGLQFFDTYFNRGDLTFILGGSVEKDSEEAMETARAKSLRLRAADDIPNEPGYCIEHAFMADQLYIDQEIVNVGIFLPSLPDVTFSISSNKDAYGDYSKAEFEKTKRSELSLLARMEAAKKLQPGTYPSRTILREGKRDVQHWHGEESLFKRKDGVHDFEWAFVGTPRDVANPSEFNVTMFTKVAHNTVGAAHVASLNDDEAVALFDKLLSGLKFRVKVPNAPEGSYYALPAKTTAQPSAMHD